MIKIILLLFLCQIGYAVMSTVRGTIDCNDKNFRDTVYDFIVAKSSNCVNTYYMYVTKKDYDVAVGTTSAHYEVRFNTNFPLLQKNIWKALKTKVKNLIANGKINKIKVEIFDSHNDMIPGTCIPDFIEERIKK